ncbi:MAG TPA: cellulase family glycosylhydrolase, partial [Rhodocyclaceae bacterium]|nr:cellulase family glycosylhydrolase [Rhodocyclaceae bacterium]
MPATRPWRLTHRLLAVLALALALPAMAQSWRANVDTVQGLPQVTKGGAPAVSSEFVFWGSNWLFAPIATRFQINAPYSYAVSGHDANLAFDLAQNVQRPASNRMAWNFDLNAVYAKTGVIGGGISFKFDLTTFAKELGPPTILADKSGWAWGPVGGNRMEMRFSPLPAAVSLAGTGDEIRVFLYNGSIPAGHTRYTATLSLAGDMGFVPTLTERFGIADPTTWPADVMDWRTSPVDLSFLNQPEIPAGRHGFLKASGERLVFQDGTVARFWGANLAAYALFTTSKDSVRQQAHRLSQLGFNLVRIHHHDSYWVNPNIFGSSSATSTLTLSPDSLDKLDWWIKCLKDEGIYVWLDMHVQRYLKPADGIDYFSEIAKGKPAADLKGYNYVNGSIQQAMRNFMGEYLGHTNPYTGKRYLDEP